MIDDGFGFQLVPWPLALERELGRQISGLVMPGGNIDWSFGRTRGLDSEISKVAHEVGVVSIKLMG
jgi:hypothetical protein